MRTRPRASAKGWLWALWLVLADRALGNEVYLSSITIYKTHDKFSEPNVYFDCKDDERDKTYLKQVRQPRRLYTVPQESVALTHITPSLCRKQCAIYDEDWVDKDDIFGGFFPICDTTFESQTKIGHINVTGEVYLELYCPLCNVYVAPPIVDAAAPSPSNASNSTASSDISAKQLPRIVGLFVLCAVLLGFLLGFVVHKVYRAWQDVEAEESRRRFQALYADPTTEIDYLPVNTIKGPNNGGFERVARGMRGWWHGQYTRVDVPTVALQQVRTPEGDSLDFVEDGSASSGGSATRITSADLEES